MVIALLHAYGYGTLMCKKPVLHYRDDAIKVIKSKHLFVCFFVFCFFVLFFFLEFAISISLTLCLTFFKSDFKTIPNFHKILDTAVTRPLLQAGLIRYLDHTLQTSNVAPLASENLK